MPQSPATGVISANMVLSANVLVAGSQYTFSLTAAYNSDGRRRLQQGDAADAASVSISVLVNTPPSGGSFEVSPTTGEQQQQRVQYNWTHDVGIPNDRRLRYDDLAECR